MKVLICPLNWGLGHATRVTPIIQLLIQNKFEVIVASSGNSLTFLQKEFRNITFIDFPNYKVKYSRKQSQILKTLFEIPGIIYCSILEHFKLKRIIKKNCIKIVISDNRFGLWNSNIYSVFITHQLKINFPGKLKVFEPIYQLLIRHVINKYDECWIPDFEGNFNLSGELSHINTETKNSYFIGPLSRFKFEKNDTKTPKIKYNVLFILSGPEPQRTLLENIFYNQTKETSLKCAIVRGTEQKTEKSFSFPVYNILNSKELCELIKESELVICRSGYSSIMDLFILRKKAVLIPTPGQTEQEYLADYLKNKSLFFSLKQKNFNLQKAVNYAYNPSHNKLVNKDNLTKRILNLTRLIHKLNK